MSEEMKLQEWKAEPEAEWLVEGALRNLPVQAPPPELFQSVMRQVRLDAQKSAPVELPVFRIRWVDFVVSLFFAVMLGLVMMVGGWLPPVVRMTLDWQWRWFQVLYLDWFLAAGVGLGAAACLLAAILFTDLYRPWVHRR